MNLNHYQEEALRTAIFPKEYSIVYPALKLAGEAGEVAEKVGKVLRDNNGLFSPEKKAELAKEIGDVLWYCAALAHGIGYTFEDIGSMNLHKLRDRKDRGVLQGSGDNR